MFCAREPVTLTGPSGTRFLVNTQGIHKGLLPKTADRLICQVLYGVSPFVRGTLDPLKMSTPEAGQIPAWTAKRPFNYVNRMFVS